MIKNLSFEHVSITSHVKKGYIRELVLSKSFDNMPIHMIISLTRPVVDEDQIRQNITYRHQEELKKSLFSEDTRQKIEEEVKSEIEMSRRIIRQMPKPIIFGAYLNEYKNGFYQKIRIKVPKEVGLYFYNVGLMLNKLLITVDIYPDYIRGDQEVAQIVSDFAEKNEDYFDTKSLLDKSQNG